MKERLVTDSATSRRMAGVRQSGTKAELLVRVAARKLGLRYRTVNKDLPGSPDLANRSRHWAVFVHGCFWHRHPDCSRATTPKRNREFWVAKFEANLRRDRASLEQLEQLGFGVVVVWECEAEDEATTQRKLSVLVGHR